MAGYFVDSQTGYSQLTDHRAHGPTGHGHGHHNWLWLWLGNLHPGLFLDTRFLDWISVSHGAPWVPMGPHGVPMAPKSSPETWYQETGWDADS